MQYSTMLSQEIQQAYKVLAQLVSQIPTTQRNLACLEGNGGQISVSDLIAYQIGWGQLLIGWYESGIQHKNPEMPGEGFSKWDYNGLAKRFYQKYHLDGSSKQMALFHETVERIISIVEIEYRADQLDKIGVWDWCTLKSGKQWPLSKWIRINTVAPYKKAVISIRKLKESGNSAC
ncbi:MAG TPA: ClbS/DfsB family four-helix bundle protein [Chlamydiales bacterium]|nr:ClbS/DfsB family four-helix bundle protein [Chlamydiales bacterium]